MGFFIPLKNKSRNGTFNFVPTTLTLFALRVLVVLEVSSLVPFYIFGSGEGGWELFHFLMDVSVFTHPVALPALCLFTPVSRCGSISRWVLILLFKASQQKHDLLVDVPHFDVSKKCAKPPLVIICLSSFLCR